METVDKLFEVIEQCTIVSIGYNSSAERKKDLIIEKLNPIRINNVIGEDFSLKPYLRDNTIDVILNEKDIKPKIFYLDAVYLRANTMRELFETVKIELLDTDYTLVISNHINTNNISIEATTMDSILYSDLVFTLSPYENKGTVIKSRITNPNIEISLEGLEDYVYRS